MDKSDVAVATFQEGFNCAQSILKTFAPGEGLTNQEATRLAAAMGGGVARRGETCGAVTGALLVLGLRYGSLDPKDQAAKNRVYQLGQRFIEEFCLRNAAPDCKDLLGCDLSLPEGLEFAQENKLFDTFCGGYVRDAAEILEKMLAEEPVNQA